MIHLANILIVTDDEVLGRDLQQKLQPHRYQVQLVAAQSEALIEAERLRPDIILLGATLGGGDPIAFATSLRQNSATSEISVCLIARQASSELHQQAFDVGMSDLLLWPVSETKLISRLRPLVRLSSMQVELQQRIAAARDFGLSADLPAKNSDGDKEDRILLIGKDLMPIVGQLKGVKSSMVGDPYQAEDALEKGSFDAAIAVVQGDPAPYLDLCVQTRNNPRLFNLPLILIADPDQVSEESAYKHGVSGYFSEPADPFLLNNTAMLLVRRQSRRWQLRDAFTDVAINEVKDPATGLFSRAFLDRYLAARIEYAQTHQRPLSIAFFRVPDVVHIHERFGYAQANHLRLQVSQWITRLLRVEDLTARYEENEFCVLLPDSLKSEASLVINRIAGVLAYTDFAVRDVYEPVKVWVRVGSAEVTENDSVATLIERARHAMIE